MGLFDDKQARDQIAAIQADIDAMNAANEARFTLLQEAIDGLKQAIGQLNQNLRVAVEANNRLAAQFNGTGSVVVLQEAVEAIQARAGDIEEDLKRSNAQVFSHIHDYVPRRNGHLTVEERAGRRRVTYHCQTCSAVMAIEDP